MSNAATMKNDTFEDYVYEAFGNIDTEIHDLRTVGWIMNCMADPSESPPEGMHRTDLSYFLAKLVDRQADRVRKITSAAQEELSERRRASR